ncbi:MAG: alpha/beta hydrolase, partial [Propionivibrio sp.]
PAGNAAMNASPQTEAIAAEVVRHEVSIPSDGETLRGWLYLPRNMAAGQKLPGIVTANALTGIKEINLPSYAERFAAAGYATLVFDYRYWGQSSGEPRYHIAPMEHHADIQNALTYLAQRQEVDATRIGGWGISMGGGHMIFLATWEPRFKAIVAVSTGIEPPVEGTPLTMQAAKARYDELVAAGKVERAARPGANITTQEAWCPQPRTGCVLPVKEAYDWYENARRTNAPTFENNLSSTSFKNMVADSVAFGIQFSQAPLLILQPENDVVPVENVLFYFKRAAAPKRLIVLPGLHTTTYERGSNFETAAAESIAWFDRYLR